MIVPIRNDDDPCFDPLGSPFEEHHRNDYQDRLHLRSIIAGSA
jgi:hypothetical protein